MRDEAAFIEFAGSARDRLRRTAYLLCGDWDRAADLVQEGLIRVYGWCVAAGSWPSPSSSAPTGSS